MNGLTGFRISPQQAAANALLAGQGAHPFGSLLQLPLDQPIDPTLLGARLERCAAEAEILRTRLVAVPGMAQAIQVIDAQAPLPLTVEDLRPLDEAARQARLDAFAAPRRAWPGALAVTLLWLSDSRQVLELAAPATHLDLASLRLLARALLGEEAGIGALQYADFAEWKWSQGEGEHGGAAYWRTAHEQAQSLPRLALEASRTGAFEPANLSLPLSAEAAQALRTRPALGLAAWGAVLARLSGQADVTVTLLDDGRGEGLEQALGAYEQALPLQLTLDPARPLSPQCEPVSGALDLALGWRDSQTLAAPAGYGYARRQAALPGERFAGSVCHAAKAVLEITETAEALQCRLVYDRGVLAPEAAACLAEQWLQMLAGTLAAPEQPFGALSLLGERQQALIRDDSAPPAVEPVSILQLIERQAQSHPAAPAVSDPDGTLDYSTLDARATGLARHLTAAGVGRGTPVGILLPRGAQAIVAILAVLKAGGAYVPLDPAYPAERRAYMVADSGLRHLVTNTALASEAPDLPGRLLIDALPPAPAAALPVPDLQAPAYLIYTSGSTGQPKAVEIPHGALSHSTQVRMALYAEPVRAYLLLSSFAFDSSVAGIFWTLAQGGCLVLPAPGEELAPDRLAALVARHRISHGLSLPSLYEALLEQAPAGALESLRAWIVAGEACPAALPPRHARLLPHARLFNEYGPTEATVWASVEALDAARDVGIGRPIPGMVLRLLNEQGAEAAVGEPGEIVLAGPTLAAGYRGKPQETARAFAALPDGTRAYRSGDLACWRADGRLAFLGRRDHQVKLRGYRIELGEIERCLREHSDVREAAVVVRDHAAGKQLLAYVVAAHGYAPDPEAMKRFLAQRLPAHMVPAQVLTLDAFPRTPNGKLDTQALPDPQALRRAQGVAPRNPTEATLAAIVAAVLRVPSVSVTDSFFEIGGDSILSLQLVARAREQGLVLTARQVFDRQTVAGMAEIAQALAPAAQGAPAESAPFSASGLDDEELQALMSELDTPVR